MEEYQRDGASRIGMRWLHTKPGVVDSAENSNQTAHGVESRRRLQNASSASIVAFARHEPNCSRSCSFIHPGERSLFTASQGTSTLPLLI